MKTMLIRTVLIASALAVPGLTPVLADDLNSTVAIRQGSHICIDSTDITNRIIPDDNTIIFRMNDGTYWQNTLQKPCTGLNIRQSFVLVTRDKYICSNQQRITVTGQGNVCWFGEFSKTTSPLKSSGG
jgi:hypothetical protein